jgi:hypothetical protein
VDARSSGRHIAPLAGFHRPSFRRTPHYSLAEIAEMWSLSTDVLRKIFQDEPGVLVLGGQSNSRKRRYTTLRVPESVLRRVHRRMTNV